MSNIKHAVMFIIIFVIPVIFLGGNAEEVYYDGWHVEHPKYVNFFCYRVRNPNGFEDEFCVLLEEDEQLEIQGCWWTHEWDFDCSDWYYADEVHIFEED